MSITIIGKGAWGNALHHVLSTHEKEIIFWDRTSRIVSDMVVLALPTNVIKDVLPFIDKKENLFIVNSSKGIEIDSHRFPYQIIADIFPDVHYFSLLGPSFAQEVIDDMPTLVNLALPAGRQVSGKAEFVKEVEQLFKTDFFRVRVVDGVEAVELGAAFKNIYAILCGIVQGIGFGVNTRTNIILLAYEEMSRLNKKLGYLMHQDAVLSIMGDLMLTCSSEESRNFMFGKNLATYSIQESLEKSKGVVEGFQSLSSVDYFAEKSGEPLVLAELIKDIMEKAGNKDEMKNIFLQHFAYV